MKRNSGEGTHQTGEMLAPRRCRAVLEISTCLECPIPGGCREGDVASGRYDGGKRDEAIYRDWLKGESYVGLSKQYGLSVTTVQKVVKRAGER